MEERRGEGDGGSETFDWKIFPYGVIAAPPLRFVNLESRGTERERYRRVLQRLRTGTALMAEQWGQKQRDK